MLVAAVAVGRLEIFRDNCGCRARAGGRNIPHRQRVAGTEESSPRRPRRARRNSRRPISFRAEGASHTREATALRAGSPPRQPSRAFVPSFVFLVVFVVKAIWTRARSKMKTRRLGIKSGASGAALRCGEIGRAFDQMRQARFSRISSVDGTYRSRADGISRTVSVLQRPKNLHHEGHEEHEGIHEGRFHSAPKAQVTSGKHLRFAPAAPDSQAVPLCLPSCSWCSLW